MKSLTDTIIRSAALMMLGTTAHAAPAARFAFRQLTVNGSSTVNATAINNSNTIVGNAVVGGVTDGFILQAGTATLLGPFQSSCFYPANCIAYPTAINKSGAVAGIVYGGDDDYGFVWQNGAFNQSDTVTITNGEGPVEGGFLFNNRGKVAYNYSRGQAQYQPYAGVPPNLVLLAPPGNEPLVSSLNNYGSVLVSAAARTGDTLDIYAQIGGEWKTILPPGASVATGGLINDHNEIAGTATFGSATTSRVFTRIAGKYSVVALPPRSGSCVAQALNDHGRVVGTCNNGTDMRLFWYNGSTSTLFARYSATDSVSLALNDADVLIVDDVTTAASYRVVCAGTGC